MKRKKMQERKIPVLVYLEPGVLEEIEYVIECLEVSRSSFIEHLIKRGLEVIKAPKETAVV